MTEEKALTKQQYLEGVTIFSAGDPANEAFLIEDGEVEIKKGDKLIATLEQGDIFGEMALIKNTDHSSTAVATKKATLVIITKETLFKKLEESDPLIAGLIHMFVKRLYKTNEAVEEG